MIKVTSELEKVSSHTGYTKLTTKYYFFGYIYMTVEKYI